MIRHLVKATITKAKKMVTAVVSKSQINYDTIQNTSFEITSNQLYSWSFLSKSYYSDDFSSSYSFSSIQELKSSLITTSSEDPTELIRAKLHNYTVILGDQTLYSHGTVQRNSQALLCIDEQNLIYKSKAVCRSDYIFKESEPIYILNGNNASTSASTSAFYICFYQNQQSVCYIAEYNEQLNALVLINIRNGIMSINLVPTINKLPMGTLVDSTDSNFKNSPIPAISTTILKSIYIAKGNFTLFKPIKYSDFGFLPIAKQREFFFLVPCSLSQAQNT